MPSRPEAQNQTLPVVGAESQHEVGRAAGRGLAWSLANNLVVRLGSFAVGIVMARLLLEAEYGVYAVGMVTLAVLLSMNELGVSVAIVHHRGAVEDIAGTVATISIISSVIVAASGFAAAPLVATQMGAPEATGVVRLLMVGVVLDGLAAVPNAMLTRRFMQRRRMMIDIVALVISTPVTIGLAVAGMGAWSLAWGAVIGNAVTAALIIRAAPQSIRPGWQRQRVRGLLRFGVPLAGASLLSLMVLNADYVVVGHTLGAGSLGLYVLAFNLCSWPITAVTSALRRVATPFFAALSRESDASGAEGFTTAFGVVCAIVAPLCVAVGSLGAHLIPILYGQRWAPATVAIQGLAVLSMVRVLAELTYDYLAGTGRTQHTVGLHLAWATTLIPALIIGARLGDLRGVAVAHASVAVVVVAPVLLFLLRRTGVRPLRLGSRAVRPAVGSAAMLGVVLLVEKVLESDVAVLLVGGPLSLCVYLAVAWPLRKDATVLWQIKTVEATDTVATVGETT